MGPVGECSVGHGGLCLWHWWVVLWYSCHLCSRSMSALGSDWTVCEAPGWKLVNFRDKWRCCFGGGLLLVLRMKSPSVGGWVHPASWLQPKTACGNGSRFIPAAKAWEREKKKEMDFANAVTLRKIRGREEEGSGSTFPSVNPARSDSPGSDVQFGAISPCFRTIFTFCSTHSSSRWPQKFSYLVLKLLSKIPWLQKMPVKWPFLWSLRCPEEVLLVSVT